MELVSRDCGILLFFHEELLMYMDENNIKSIFCSFLLQTRMLLLFIL